MLFGIIIVCILVIRFYVNYKNAIYDTSLKHVDINNITFNTGDVILFRHDADLLYSGDTAVFDYDVVKKTLVKSLMLYQPFYTHVGVIIEINNIPHVLHLTIDHHFDVYTNRWKRSAPSLIPVNELLYYKGHVYLRKNKNETVIKNIHSLFEDVYKMRLPTSYLVATVNKLLNRRYGHSRAMCSDLVMYVLDKLNLIKFNYTHSTMNDVVNALNKSNNFEDAVMIRTGYYFANTQTCHTDCHIKY